MVVLGLFAMASTRSAAGEDRTYPWSSEPVAERDTIEGRFRPPEGFVRVAAPPGSFGWWLRGLPLVPGRGTIHLYDGSPRPDQSGHLAVIRIDVGPRDLQQCADFVIRMRAEYLYSLGRWRDIAFRFTSGDLARFSDWASGVRPRVRGAEVRWVRTGRVGHDHRALRRYLDVVFTYAGSYSLARDLVKLHDPSRLQIGDVLVHGGFPGHAVLVVDMARGSDDVLFMLAQSYMPAQDPHVLVNPATGGPWFSLGRLVATGRLHTPDWDFTLDELETWPGIGGHGAHGR